jgi:hypothetical protein
VAYDPIDFSKLKREPPTYLYRYVSLAKFVDFLETKSIFFCKSLHHRFAEARTTRDIDTETAS